MEIEAKDSHSMLDFVACVYEMLSDPTITDGEIIDFLIDARDDYEAILLRTGIWKQGLTVIKGGKK